MLRADLKRVRERIAMGWTQGVNARTKDGFPVASVSEEAVCWCLMGAALVERISLSGVEDALKLPRLVDWNDETGRTQAEVLARIDKAIAAAGEAK